MMISAGESTEAPRAPVHLNAHLTLKQIQGAQ
jgi:hypothetical protein